MESGLELEEAKRTRVRIVFLWFEHVASEAGRDDEIAFDKVCWVLELGIAGGADAGISACVRKLMTALRNRACGFASVAIACQISR